MHRAIPGARVQLNGPAPALDMSPLKLRRPADYPICWPYALTKIPADLWAAWYAANAQSDLVLSRSVFALKTEDDAKAACRELEEEPTGLEEVDADNPTRRAGYGGEIRELKGLPVKVAKGDRAK
jgi:hypothetical protein